MSQSNRAAPRMLVLLALLSGGRSHRALAQTLALVAACAGLLAGRRQPPAHRRAAAGGRAAPNRNQRCRSRRPRWAVPPARQLFASYAEQVLVVAVCGASLRGIAGVYSIQTGPTIAKPVIHGLYGNRMLILNNGVRQEGQQWGLDHAPKIDRFTATRLTVIKGAASVRYRVMLSAAWCWWSRPRCPTQPA